jgi:Zn-dependent peptidase ImmA (M78 family)
MKPDLKKAEQEALRVLQENYITSAPVPIVDLLEFIGLGLIRSEFADGEISGVIDLEKKYLYVNKNDSFERQRFTIAHELGHWILHRSEMQSNKEIAVLYRRSIGTSENPAWEQEADCFAGNLLVPEFLLKRTIAELEKTGLAEDALLAKQFEVSRPVIGYRRRLLEI